jgi:dethiobiotin synthetase
VRGLFIAGTDTGVGKTTVGCGLLRLARRRGLALLPFKPAETGVDPDPLDTLALRAAAGRGDIPIAEICPYRFQPPIAPAAAAALAGVTITMTVIAAAAARQSARGDGLLVEGAGGLLSPYGPRLTCADVAQGLGLPVLLVARNGLGTVNHSALALAEIERRGLTLVGLVLVDTAPVPTPDRDSNAALIMEMTGVRALGTLGHVSGAALAAPPYTGDAVADVADTFADALARAVDVHALLAACLDPSAAG